VNVVCEWRWWVGGRCNATRTVCQTLVTVLLGVVTVCTERGKTKRKREKTNKIGSNPSEIEVF
jgi:hypothetical protein